MSEAFPVTKVVKGALLVPVSNLKGLLVSAVALGLPIWMVLYLEGLVTDLTLRLQELGTEGGAATEEMAASLLSYTGGLLLGMLLLLYVSAVIFNYWVRVGAGHTEDAVQKPVSRVLVQGLKNALKFILVGAVMLIVIALVIMILGVFGVPGFSLDEIMANMEETDVALMMRNTFVLNVVMTGVVCFIYAIFSSSLTKTALDNPDYELGETQNAGFGAAIFIIYMMVFVPGFLASQIAGEPAMTIVQAIFSFYGVLAIPVAHGLRYNFCRAQPEIGETFS